MDKVAQINARLKAARVPIRVRLHGGSLYLRSSKLPPKPGDSPGKRYELPQGPASAANLAKIEATAHTLWRSVVENRFDWSSYSRGKTGTTVAEWCQRFRKHHLSTTSCTERTFERFWEEEVISRLPQNVELTGSLILAAVLVTPENTRLRKQTCQKLQALASYADIEVDLKPYQGKYGQSAVKRRELPTDEEIENYYTNIPNEKWRRIFARLVIFGLRPSESFFFESIDCYTAKVIDCKSNQPRETKAFHPYWADRWEVAGEVPNISWRSHSKNEDVSQRIAAQFYKYGVRCQRYDFRHAWCVRVSVEYKVPVSVAAKWAGHSEALHLNTYSRWIRADQQNKIYNELVLKKPSETQ